MATYTCKYCGTQVSYPNQVNGCDKNPHSKSHEWLG